MQIDVNRHSITFTNIRINNGNSSSQSEYKCCYSELLPCSFNTIKEFFNIYIDSGSLDI